MVIHQPRERHPFKTALKICVFRIISILVCQLHNVKRRFITNHIIIEILHCQNLSGLSSRPVDRHIEVIEEPYHKTKQWQGYQHRFDEFPVYRDKQQEIKNYIYQGHLRLIQERREKQEQKNPVIYKIPEIIL